MSQRAGSRAPRVSFARRAAVAAGARHLLAPIGVAVWIYGGRQQAAREAQRAQEMDVEFEDATAAELPKDLPPIEPPPDQLQPPKPSRRSRRPRAQPKQEAEGAAAEEAASRSQRKRRTQPEPKRRGADAAAAAAAEPKAHEKIVDLDNEKKVEPPPDAKYLAQKNNRADEETRATRHEPREDAEGGGQRRRSRTARTPQPGGDKEKVAELEDQKSALGRKAPDVTPHENPRGRPSTKDQHRARIRCWRCAIRRRARTS